jgi:hypothetical protein
MNPAALANLLTIKKGDKEGTPIQNAFALIILVGGGYLLFSKIKKELKDAAQKKKNDELYKDEQDPKIKLSYKRSQFEAWADKLEDAILGTTFNNTDEEEIYRVLRFLKTNNDWLELNRAFGIRKWYNSQIPFHFGTDKNLVSSLQADLDSDEKQKVNKILEIRNIKYRI